MNLLKPLLWLYFLLLVGEGVLRKWIAPGLSEPLLIVRDPVALAIYAAALATGRFPWRLSLLVLAALAGLSLLFAVIASAPLFVAIYGLRINYFHVPLIFVLATALDREDVLRLGRVVLWLTPPIVAIMVLQYQAGPGSRWNVGAGGGLDGQLTGALGKLRPSGPFSFISGVVLWCSLAAAFVFHGWTHRDTFPRWLLAAATIALVVAVPVSISRMVLFSVLVVLAFGLITLLGRPGRIAGLLVPAVVALAAFSFISDGELTAAFEARWETSTGAGVQHSIVNRFFGEFLSSLDVLSHAPLFGHGVGLGSNVGTRYVTGSMGFALAESEWAKILLELGPLLGVGFIAYRCWLAASLTLAALGHLVRGGDNLPWLLCGAVVVSVVSGQWAPPTILGFTVFGTGLVHAALNDPEPDDDDEPLDDTDPEESPA
jgi:hypothetical protein